MQGGGRGGIQLGCEAAHSNGRRSVCRWDGGGGAQTAASSAATAACSAWSMPASADRSLAPSTAAPAPLPPAVTAKNAAGGAQQLGVSQTLVCDTCCRRSTQSEQSGWKQSGRAVTFGRVRLLTSWGPCRGCRCPHCLLFSQRLGPNAEHLLRRRRGWQRRWRRRRRWRQRQRCRLVYTLWLQWWQRWPRRCRCIRRQLATGRARKAGTDSLPFIRQLLPEKPRKPLSTAGAQQRLQQSQQCGHGHQQQRAQKSESSCGLFQPRVATQLCDTTS